MQIKSVYDIFIILYYFLTFFKVKTMDNDKKLLPLLMLRGKIMFPNISSTFDIGRKPSLLALETSLKYERKILVVSQKDSAEEDPQPDGVYKTGVLCEIGSVSSSTPVTARVKLVGICRAVAGEIIYNQELGCFFAEYERVDDDLSVAPIETDAYFSVVREKFKDYAKTNKGVETSLAETLIGIETPSDYVNIAAFNLPIKESVKQTILETVYINDRLELLAKELTDLIAAAKYAELIQERVRKNVDESQKDYYLREQLKAIHEELGDDGSEIDRLREKVKAKGMSSENEAKVLKELDRMSRMNSSSPDYTVIRTYVDWVLDLPFKEVSKDTENLSDAIAVLESDHFGLEKVKERIIEHLAVMKLTGKVGGSILCLVGPPGVGKTSVATSVARALSRKFARMSLGGVKDEAEIRGHRKTYIGAMPGRIIYALKDAGVKNPVILLDEIDKLSSDLRGDPASALLEVLDPEQNKTFRDRYIELPYDLSDVLFITTANTLDTIPAPLLDRMEIISLDGYTREEKFEIAKRYLIPKRLEKNGVPLGKIEFSEDAIYEIIKGYTKEAGVRNLEREIDAVIRKIATEYAKSGAIRKKNISARSLKTYLGSPKFVDEDAVSTDQVGAVNGLAWTALGGVTLTCECSIVGGGKGELILTGKLGDVMKESARAAVSYIKANADRLGVNADAFENSDVHIHFPEGATPKDGPSAGVTIATAILSAVTGRKVRSDVAMTGEITLLGNVLRIGGLKEKSLAAYRAGIKKIIIPFGNIKDEEEVPAAVRGEIEFIPVKKAEEVFRVALI